MTNLEIKKLARQGKKAVWRILADGKPTRVQVAINYETSVSNYAQAHLQHENGNYLPIFGLKRCLPRKAEVEDFFLKVARMYFDRHPEPQ